MKRKLWAFVLVLLFAALPLAACGGGSGGGDSDSAGDSDADAAGEAEVTKVYAFVSKDINNPYMQKVFEGFEAACGEIGVEALYRGPETPTPEAQIEVINQLVSQNVNAICVAANDADALQPSLVAAMDSGIAVISLDSAVNKDSRVVHVQQADPEKIGRTLIQAAYDMADGEGGLAILSATAQATNQNLWIEWMQKELEENADKYANTPLVKIAYGDDLPEKSTSETQALLRNPDIKVIIAPTTVGMLAAGKYMQDNQTEVLLTGLGLPSEMAPFIEDGVCPWMYLWNPVDLGYLASYVADAIVNGNITGAEGETLSAGTMGDKSVTAAADGGTEVMLGNPFQFDQANISEWKEVY